MFALGAHSRPHAGFAAEGKARRLVPMPLAWGSARLLKFERGVAEMD